MPKLNLTKKDFDPDEIKYAQTPSTKESLASIAESLKRIANVLEAAM